MEIINIFCLKIISILKAPIQSQCFIVYIVFINKNVILKNILIIYKFWIIINKDLNFNFCITFLWKNVYPVDKKLSFI